MSAASAGPGDASSPERNDRWKTLPSQRTLSSNRIIVSLGEMGGFAQKVVYQSAKRTNDSSPAVHCWEKEGRICSP